MSSRIRVAMAGASLLALAFTTAAHAAQPAEAAAPAAVPADETELGEVVVTARRRSESLQQVPQVVNAVTADALDKLNIRRFEDVQAVVPGLNLASSNNGFQSGASLRGVSFDVTTSADPTVAMYLNDAPVETNFLFQSMFDIGQVEVLRGPQGTTRGVAAPSGAITVSTRKPNLSEVGGYVNATVTDHHGRNVQGAINVPVIQDLLAVRVAGLLDQDDFDGVRSVTNPLRPRNVTSAFRASVAFEPSDLFNANIAYQHLDKEQSTFTQVVGAGNGRNGPVIGIGDRLSGSNESNEVRQHTDVVTAQIDSRIFGQHLSYVGSYQHLNLRSRSAQDAGNLLIGADYFQNTAITREGTTHELRLASDPAPGRFVDYTVGAFYQWLDNNSRVVQPAQYLPGAFNPTGPLDVSTFNPRYVQNSISLSPSMVQETSFFGNLTFHLGENTELSGGLRHIISVSKEASQVLTDAGIAAVPCSATVTTPSAYPGFCETTPASARAGVQFNLPRRRTDRPTIYNISLSHRFSRDLLVYANHGTSWRRGPTVKGIFNAANDPTLTNLIYQPNETSRAYEVGVKSTLLDGRARLNVAVFRQTFKNLIFRTTPVPYLRVTSSNDPGSVDTAFGFTAAANAVVEGIDVDAALQITRNWNISAAVSYSDGRVDNDLVPCRDVNFDGVADPTGSPTAAQFRAAGRFVAMCRSTGSVSLNPLWNASIQSEYVQPVRDGVDGFVRGLFSYYPENARANTNFAVNPYSIVNLYAGLRSTDGAWEVSLFAKNAFETEELLTQGVDPYTSSPLGRNFPSLASGSGYYAASVTPEREIGINVRYAFGSR